MPDYSVTVLVPTYNHERYIYDAIKSIKRQTLFDECLVIVSDDCSADQTLRLAERAASSPNILVQCTPSNLGVMRHYQRLVARVETPFTAILEGDDLWLGNQRLELMREMLERNEEMSMCFSACIVDDLRNVNRYKHPSWNNGRHRIINIIDLVNSDNPIATFSNCLYRTSCIKNALSDFDSSAGYDWLCHMRIALSGDVGFFAQPSTLYRIHHLGQWSRLEVREREVLIRKGLDFILASAPTDLKEFIRDARRRRFHE